MTALLTVHSGEGGTNGDVFSGVGVGTRRTPILRRVGRINGRPYPSLMSVRRLLSFVSPRRLSGFVYRCTSAGLRFGATLSGRFVTGRLSLSSGKGSCEVRVRGIFGKSNCRGESHCRGHCSGCSHS